MHKQKTLWLDPVLLIGLFISIFISVAVVLISNDTISSLIIGLLSTIITLLVDIIARIQKAEGAFLDAAGLSRILSDKYIGSSLQDIAYSNESIKRYNFEHYDTIAQAAIDECRAKFREIAGGSVIVAEKTIQAYGVKGIQQVRRDVKVIHIGSMDFWSSDFGKRYFELNRAAVKRGVVITRIFALTSEEVKNSLDKLKEQERAGIRVLVMKPNRLNQEFILFDDKILIDFDVDTRKESRLERITLDPTQVNKKRDEFQELITRYARAIKDIL